MGASVLLDIIGSAVVGGILLLILFRLNESATENTFNYAGELMVQENIVEVVKLLEYDLRKIAYCDNPVKIPNKSRAILYADTNQLKYLTDIDFDGTVDTVHYYFVESDLLLNTPNPNDKLLVRSINGQPLTANLGITEFKLKFFSILNVELTPPLYSPTGIFSLQVDVKCENTSAYDEQYRYAFWRQIRMASRNLDGR